MVIACTICARGGSKGVKNKNIKLINGRPLIYYSIFQAKKTKMFDIVAVSSDSDDILEIAKDCHADYLIKRPEYLATDTSAKLPVIKHAMNEVEKKLGQTIDILVDLDCTSPLRSVEDIIGCIELQKSTSAKNIITGSLARRSPYFNLVEEQGDGFVYLSKPTDYPIVRRQDVPKCYDMNASIYVWTRENLLNVESIINRGTKLYEMPESRSIDIDTELDFSIVEFLIKQREDLC